MLTDCCLLNDVILNSNPEGCNQHTGPGCSGGGGTPSTPTPRYLSKTDFNQAIKQLKSAKLINDDNTISLYHVTTEDRLDSIKEKGLVPAKEGASGQSWKAAHSPYATYFHADKEAAEANLSQGFEGSILVEARIPVTPENLGKIIPDEETSKDLANGIESLKTKQAVALIGGAPKETIRPVSRINAKGAVEKIKSESPTTPKHSTATLPKIGTAVKFKGKTVQVFSHHRSGSVGIEMKDGSIKYVQPEEILHNAHSEILQGILEMNSNPEDPNQYTPIDDIDAVLNRWITTEDGNRLFIDDDTGELKTRPGGETVTEPAKQSKEAPKVSSANPEQTPSKEFPSKDSLSPTGMITALKGKGFNIESALADKLRPETLKQLHDQLHAAEKRFPGLAKTISMIRDGKLEKGVPGTLREEGTSRILIIDTKQDTDKTNSAIKKSQANGWLASGGGIEGIIAHEIAHAVDKAPFTDQQNWNLGKARSYLRKNPPSKTDLSGYGTEKGPHQKEEMFAEAVAAAMTKTNPNAWQKGFNSLFHELSTNSEILQGILEMNSNPEGCNQHTGPGCSVGGEVSEHTSLDSLGSKITEHPPSQYTPGFYSSPKGATSTRFSGIAEVGKLKTKVYRVGDIKAKPESGGTFFGGDAESIKAYVGLHPGQEIKEYEIELDKVIVAGHQNDLTQAWFGKSYGELMDSFQRKLGRTKGASSATAAFDKKIFTEAKKRGYDAIAYMSPAPPAKTELAIVGDANKKIIKTG